MTAQMWMDVGQVAAESGRHPRTVNHALRRGLLVGVQPSPRARWRVTRASFNRWEQAGCPWQISGRWSA